MIKVGNTIVFRHGLDDIEGKVRSAYTSHHVRRLVVDIGKELRVVREDKVQLLPAAPLGYWIKK